MDYLTQALTLADEIFKMSSDLKLTGQLKLAEKEIDAYTELINKRDPMIKKLKQLLQQNTSEDVTKKQKIDGVLSQILECEKEHNRIMEHLKKSVASSLKETRSGQKLNHAYANPYEGLAPQRLDAKQ